MVHMLLFIIFFTAASRDFTMLVADGDRISTMNSSGAITQSYIFSSTVGSVAIDSGHQDFGIVYSLFNNGSVIYNRTGGKTDVVTQLAGNEHFAM